jgi:acyl carrier protein
MNESFSGFLPILQDINITEETSLMLTDGELASGHLVRLIMTNEEEVMFSISKDKLQSLFFLLGKIFMG